MHHAATITRIRCLCLARSRETSVIGNPGYREVGSFPRLHSSGRTVGKWHGTKRCNHWSVEDVPVRPKSLRHQSFHSRDLMRTNRLTVQATRRIWNSCEEPKFGRGIVKLPMCSETMETLDKAWAASVSCFDQLALVV